MGDKLRIVAPNYLEDGSKPIDLTKVDTIVFKIAEVWNINNNYNQID